MTSELRKATARANGAKSRGPKTPEGKRKSARNSLKHGLYADPDLILAEFPERLAEFIDAGMAEFHPQSATAVDLVYAMAAAELLHERSLATETNLLDAEMARLAEIDKSADPPTLRARAFFTLSDSCILPVIWHAESRYQRLHSTASDLLRKVLARTRIEEENYKFTERTKLSGTVKITERTKLSNFPTFVVKSGGPAKFVPTANQSTHPDASSSLNASKARGGASVKLNASDYLPALSTHSSGANL
jgi:hypothetical protein